MNHSWYWSYCHLDHTRSCDCVIANGDVSGVEHVLIVVATGVAVVAGRAWFAAAVAGVGGVAGNLCLL